MSDTTVRQLVRPGTVLWRVHDRAGSPHEPADSPGIPARFSPDQVCALAEGLLPTPKFSRRGVVSLTPRKLRGKYLSAVRTRTELTVASVRSARSARAVGRAARPDDQDTVHGASWLSTPVWPEPVFVLFADRLPPGALAPLPDLTTRLDDERGFTWLRDVLAGHHIQVAGRAPRRDPLVFVNYRSSAGTEEVMLLDEELCARFGERRVFRDRRLGVGTEYPTALLTKARDTEVLVAVIGRHWEGEQPATGHRLLDDPDDWIRREIAEAFRHRVTVVPVLVGLRHELVAEDLPADIRRLASLQALHLRHRCARADVRSLVDDLVAQVPALAEAHGDHAGNGGAPRPAT